MPPRRVPHRATALLALVFALAPGLSAQSAEVQVHIRHVTEAFMGTPGGLGLLPTAMAEADIALRHLGFAAADSTSVSVIRMHVAHALHALDPAAAPGGPGLGYGIRRAAEEAALHVQMAADAEGATGNVIFHAEHVATAALNVARQVDAVVALGKRVESAPSPAAALPLLAELTARTEALLGGRDADGDGLVGWQRGEGGLRQATWHMNLMRRGEGLAP
ncbi:MAG TPA: hypothetical protein VFQ22_10115 [Longimicrobiales bacterium]|nr:hypothetical protein [Longimicrobiales bacterium]